ncbi:MAG TPA: hypothetical protein VG897_13790, partial [Terriglobales bacterium]|nr:hypothetical protein [Terriglobales bacterium]
MCVAYSAFIGCVAFIPIIVETLSLKKFTFLLTLLFVIVGAPLASSAQANVFTLFLGKSNGHALLYRAAADGSAQAVSASDVGSVLLYDADTTDAAYIGEAANKSLTLYLTNLNSLATTSASLSSSQVSQIVLTDNSVELVARSADGKPTLLTFERATLKPVAERSTRRVDSVWTIQP